LLIPYSSGFKKNSVVEFFFNYYISKSKKKNLQEITLWRKGEKHLKGMQNRNEPSHLVSGKDGPKGSEAPRTTIQSVEPSGSLDNTDSENDHNHSPMNEGDDEQIRSSIEDSTSE